MKILIGGDVCPINSNELLFSSQSKNVFGSFQELFEDADISIINLEVPLTSSDIKIMKSGGNIKGKPESIMGLQRAGIDVISLANNHLGDYGEKGVLDTLELLKRVGIQTVGAGKNINEAKEILAITRQEKRVAILSFSDIEFGIATKETPGANPLDLKTLTLQLIEIKDKFDFCIVLLHEGKEHYEYPSPRLQELCRFICDLGADLVICQHSHISGAFEKYNSSNIVYGQGNLLFDYENRKSHSWVNGYLISVDISKAENNIELIPFKQTFPGIITLNKDEEMIFREKMEFLSQQVLDEEFIKENWINFIQRYEKTYYSIFRGHNAIQRKIFSYIPFHNWFYNKKQKAFLLNIIRSRVHREVLIDLLNK